MRPRCRPPLVGGIIGNNGIGSVKLQPQAVDSFGRIYAGGDGMATNGLRYGARSKSLARRHKQKDCERNRDDTGPDANDPKEAAPTNPSSMACLVRASAPGYCKALRVVIVKL